MVDRRSHNADITGSHGNRMGGKYVFTGSTKHIDHLKKSVRIQSLEKLFYMGFTREIVDNLRTELSKLLDMEEE